MKVSKRKYLWRMFSLTLFCALGLSAAAVGSFAQRGSQDLIIVNKTGVVIAALYATPHNSDDWGEDILGADLLANNDELGIVFSRKETAQLWDIRIEDSDGAFIEWEKINIRAVSTITLYYKNGKATAIFVDRTPNVAGTWVGYYDDGTRSPYVWRITQNGSNINITDTKKASTRSRGTVAGNAVRATDFATQNGTLSPDGRRIQWSDGVVWVKSPDAPDLNGVWVGYYDDGSRSPYIWNIGHTGSTLTIQDARTGGTTRSRGSIQGNKITANDFATKNGTLSADGNQIRWSDGVVWRRE